MNQQSQIIDNSQESVSKKYGNGKWSKSEH